MQEMKQDFYYYYYREFVDEMIIEIHEMKKNISYYPKDKRQETTPIHVPQILKNFFSIIDIQEMKKNFLN